MFSFDDDPASAASRNCSSSSPITTENPLLRASNPLVSDLEQEVLDEYTRLLGNVNKLSDKLAGLAGDPTSLTLDGLRLLERKTATVCTLLKASVYSIVLQQQMINESEEQQHQEQQQQQQYEDGQDERLQGQGMGYEGDDVHGHGLGFAWGAWTAFVYPVF
ncbi:hypothetical protein KXV81_003826 [Aspergillus fumigatus]|nr:hypothetical protein KXX45_001063 [Aspergillus fumigatus]KMK59777.1 DASH complex subunit DAD2 [Aspergillus fumigatus Z5]KAH1294654.1 hypothetical protein KXX30_002450 [Aspergillus fumigatus]KAH1308511.1 hypothetical protein KXX11_002792 [Aspergillus fumigatus]KAH1323532.1 hypothetical protein KXX66_008068 [Aspergillus fumigatus]